MIKHRSLLLENDRKLDIFDNVFPMTLRTTFFNFCKNSYFKIGWSDTSVPERKAHDYFLHSAYSQQDVDDLGIFKYFKNTPISDRIGNLRLKRTVLNLSTPSDVHYIHVHGTEDLVVLSYVNLDWQDGWHGETQFYSEDCKEIQFTCPYTPGRVIAFDPKIPHAIRPQSIIAPQYRFTLTMCFDSLNK